MKDKIITSMLIVALIIAVILVKMIPVPEQAEESKWNGEGYHGWDMPCNYAFGSNADWDEETKEYGDQRYLNCANGLVYEKIGISSSVHYFNADDQETNAKYCKEGEVATFYHADAITGEPEGRFNDCMNW